MGSSIGSFLTGFIGGFGTSTLMMLALWYKIKKRHAGPSPSHTTSNYASQLYEEINTASRPNKDLQVQQNSAYGQL